MLELAFDLGTSFIGVYEKEKGILLREPNVAVVAKVKNKVTLKAMGESARQFIAKGPVKDQIVYPMKEGVIAYPEVLTLIVKELLTRVVSKHIVWPKIKAVVTVSCGLSPLERRNVEMVFIKAGVSQVTLIEAPVAVNALLPGKYNVIVIIGGGITDIAATGPEGILTGCSVNIAGNIFNSQIVDYFAKKFKLVIGQFTADKVKRAVGSLLPNDISMVTVTGKDMISGEPKNVEVSAMDVRIVLENCIDDVIEAVNSVLCSMPGEIAMDIYNQGIFICGGSTNIVGLAEYMSSKLLVKVNQMPDASNAQLNGAGKFLTEKGLIERYIATAGSM